MTSCAPKPSLRDIRICNESLHPFKQNILISELGNGNWPIATPPEATDKQFLWHNAEQQPNTYGSHYNKPAKVNCRRTTTCSHTTSADNDPWTSRVSRYRRVVRPKQIQLLREDVWILRLLGYIKVSCKWGNQMWVESDHTPLIQISINNSLLIKVGRDG